MPRDPQQLLFVGIKDVVLALRQADGAEVWVIVRDSLHTRSDRSKMLAPSATRLSCNPPPPSVDS
jgi:hypothetical protein